MFMFTLKNVAGKGFNMRKNLPFSIKKNNHGGKDIAKICQNLNATLCLKTSD